MIYISFKLTLYIYIDFFFKLPSNLIQQILCENLLQCSIQCSFYRSELLYKRFNKTFEPMFFISKKFLMVKKILSPILFRRTYNLRKLISRINNDYLSIF